ncbi:hypothetical protein [Ruegeria sp. PrR005]|uniref:Uncharacterized protein n=1 Tax=Ruegeria sp. PrR005 TaxID=2706882 RepID=A0A6B2NQC8_9RHOB|nr:hypothetical protein [Ruegeria sp. PrR005]NDW44777.1 hypothetical protein [Ruegeria sp. PrR005]
MARDAGTRPAIDRLLRGVATDHVETLRDAWRDLLRDGDGSVDLVRQKLASGAWAENPRGPLARYFGVLLALLDELDRAAFAQEVQRLRKARLHPAHAATLDVLARRVLDKPVAFAAEGVPIYVASEIAGRTVVAAKVQKWSRTRTLSLANVTRIDVISQREDMDYLGRYNLFFSGIVLAWPKAPLRGVWRWLRDLQVEHTFYHEVGHHTCGHIEGGQVAAQEREADAYARSMLRLSRPVFMRVGPVLFWPFKAVLGRRKGTPGNRP